MEKDFDRFVCFLHDDSHFINVHPIKKQENIYVYMGEIKLN